MTQSIIESQNLTDRDLIESILGSFYIIDYGYITKVNQDGTINVTHASLQTTRSGNNLPPTQTTNLEVLTLSSAGFALKYELKPNDKVLLLGFKTQIKSVADVKSATEQKTFQHYTRATIKALPLCVFDDKAKVQIEVKNGNMAVACSKFSITDSNGIAALEVTP